MKSWAKDANIDVISPILYSNGNESSPMFDETWACKNAGCTWDLYENAKARFVPTIVDASQYAEVKDWFAAKGIETSGFFQWEQTVDFNDYTSSGTIDDDSESGDDGFCGGNCPQGGCDECPCGNDSNKYNIADFCSTQSRWPQATCECII